MDGAQTPGFWLEEWSKTSGFRQAPAMAFLLWHELLSIAE